MGYMAPLIVAAQKAKEQAEEEAMTRYSTEELEGDWEFKMVRGSFNAFRNPQRLQQVIEEEARSGWELVEKFDDERLRFKRRRSERERDFGLKEAGINPYRSSYGSDDNYMIMVIVGLVVLLLLGVVLFAGFVAPGASSMIILAAIVAIGIMVLVGVVGSRKFSR